uniref:Carbohydrate ABC transporter substrate-binding protein n=1 Tax=Thermofilum pendens TaxID=2269 RepID=A0A7C4F9C7_THEPE
MAETAKSRKYLYIAVAVVIIAIIGIALYYFLTPPPTPTQPTAPPTQKVKIRVQIGWSGKELEAFDLAVKEYMKKNPNVEIEYVIMRAEDLAAVLPAQLEARTYPAEIMVTPWSWFIVEQAKKGHLEDLSNLLPWNDFVPGYTDLVTYNGKIYGVPFGLYFKPLWWYRKSVFQKYGLSEPKTWDEFVALLDKLKTIPQFKKPVVIGDTLGWPASDVVEGFIIALGSPDMHAALTKGTLRFNDPGVQAIFRDKLVPLIKAGYFSEPVEWTSAHELWWNGEYAVYPLGSFLASMVKDPEDLGAFVVPGSTGLIGNVDFFFVSKYVPDDLKPVVYDFLKWLATEGQVIMASIPSGRVPTWKKADVNRIYAPFRDLYQKAVTGYKFVPDMDDTVGGDWQRLFWEYCKVLFTSPDRWSEMLTELTRQHPATKG